MRQIDWVVYCKAPLAGPKQVLRYLSRCTHRVRHIHRIRHYSILASANRADNIATARALLGVAPFAAEPQKEPDITPDAPTVLPGTCLHCGVRMLVIEAVARGCEPKWR
jgi:hypothetical protein